MPIELSDAIARRREVTFTFYGNEMHAEYWVEKITQQFQVEMMRLLRMGERMKQRARLVAEAVAKVDALPDTEDYSTEETDAERALTQYNQEDQRTKTQIDNLLITLLASWDLLDHGVPVAFTPEAMAPVPSEFEGYLIAAILEDARGLGERNGSGNITPLQTTSSRKERRAASRRRPTG